MNKEDLIDKLEIHHLNGVFEKIESQIRDTIRLHPIAQSEKDISLGQTKIGGRPDLPKEQLWPVEVTEVKEKKFWFFTKSTEVIRTKPLSFIAQINLEEIAEFDTENLFPKHGILYFFYAAEQDAWGYEPNDKNKFKVVFYGGDTTELIRTDFPDDLEESAIFKPCSVLIYKEISLPYYDNEVYSSFTKEEDEKFWDNIYEEGNVNKLLGYSDNIQHEMELECELATNGFNCGDGSPFNEHKAKELAPNAEKWLLLLQIDSNEENDMMWGDAGRIYFWIRKDDLANRRFENV